MSKNINLYFTFILDILIDKLIKMQKINKIFAFITVILIAISCIQNKEKQPNNLSNETSEYTAPVESKNISTKLDSTKYEILATDHQTSVENFHIFLKTTKPDKGTLQDFVDKFREEFCSKKCNISVYDDKTIKALVTKYPLSDKEYLKIADHFVATSTFDMLEVWLYPFQDIKYKELGGKNWKKEPIK